MSTQCRLSTKHGLDLVPAVWGRLGIRSLAMPKCGLAVLATRLLWAAWLFQPRGRIGGGLRGGRDEGFAWRPADASSVVSSSWRVASLRVFDAMRSMALMIDILWLGFIAGLCLNHLITRTSSVPASNLIMPALVSAVRAD